MSDDEVEFVYSQSQYQRKTLTLQQEVENKESQVKEFQTVKVQLESQNKDLLEMIQQQKLQIETLSAKNEKYMETLKDRDTQILEVLKEKMALTSQISQLKDQIASLQKDSTGRNQLEALEQNIKSLNTQLQALKQENVALTKDMAQQVKLVDSKEKEVAKFKKEIQKLESQYNEHLSQILDKTEEKQRDQVTQAQVKSLTEQLERVTQNSKSMEKEAQAMIVEQNSLKNQNQVLFDQVSKLTQQLQLAQSQLAQSTFVQVGGDQGKKFQDMQEKYQRMEKTCLEQKQFIDEVINQNARLQGEVEIYKEEMKNNTQLELFRQQIQNLEAMLYESPIELVFSLIEDRLSKAMQKQPDDRKERKKYWTAYVKQMTEQLHQFGSNLQKLNINFNFQMAHK